MQIKDIKQLYNYLSDFQQECTPCKNDWCNQGCDFYRSESYSYHCSIDSILYQLDQILMTHKNEGDNYDYNL